MWPSIAVALLMGVLCIAKPYLFFSSYMSAKARARRVMFSRICGVMLIIAAIVMTVGQLSAAMHGAG